MSEVSEEKWWGGRRKAGGRKEGAADAALKTKTPHVNVGNNRSPICSIQTRNPNAACPSTAVITPPKKNFVLEDI